MSYSRRRTGVPQLDAAGATRDTIGFLEKGL